MACFILIRINVVIFFIRPLSVKNYFQCFCCTGSNNYTACNFIGSVFIFFVMINFSFSPNSNRRCNTYGIC